MIKLKPLLERSRDNVEGGARSKPIDLDAAIDIIKRKAQEAWSKYKDGKRIHRGIKTDGLAFFVQPSTTYRYARNTNNIVNALIDIVPSWKDWPKRSRSIVGSTEAHNAKYYGNACTVFPLDGARIGVCSDVDFWSSFGNMSQRLQGYDVAQINDEIVHLFEKTGLYDRWDNVTSEDMLKKLQAFDRLHVDGQFDIEFRVQPTIIVGDILQHYRGDLLGYFSELLDPEKNGFHLTPIDSYPYSGGLRTREVWTDSDSVLIKTSEMGNVEERLRS